MSSFLQKTIFSACAYIALLFAGACNPTDPCNCKAYSGRTAIPEGLSVNLKQKLDSAVATSQKTDTFFAAQYAFGVIVQTRYVWNAQPQVRNPFLSAAYACDCAEPETHLRDTLESFRVFAKTNSFGIEEGTDITDMFNAVVGLYPIMPIIPAKDIRTAFNANVAYGLPETDLFFMKPEALPPGLFSASVTLVFHNGRSFTIDVPSTYIK